MKTLRTTTLIIGILTILSANIANAAYLNLGTLDVRPVQTGGTNAEWFIEYGSRGQDIIRYIQIANFSPEKKDVEIYSTDSTTKLGTNFMVKTKEESPEKISPWMTMPATSLTLLGGETKVVPVKISIPQNAGVGLHTGAVIVREKTKADGTEFHVEKGIRFYLNVKGSAIENAAVTGGRAIQGNKTIGLGMIVENKGTTDFDSRLSLELDGLNGETVAIQNVNGYVRPEEKSIISLEVAKPAFGIYRAVLRTEQPLNGQTTFDAGTVVVLPLWALLLALGLVMAASLLTSPEKNRALSFRFDFRKLLENASLKKSAEFLGILALGVMIALPLQNLSFSQNYFAAVLQGGNPDSYEVAIKWGNMKKMTWSSKDKTEWHGQITLTGGTATIRQDLNLEANDAINLINDGTTVNFNLTTDTNNDGVILDIIPTGTDSPKILFENFTSNSKLTFDLKKIAGGKITIPNHLSATTIDVREITAGQLHGASGLTEESATPETQATPEININIPELKNIFHDIPATPEVLSEFILTSDYVKKISTENAVTKVEADSALIKALQATPEIINEIASTPNLNFTFIPSETVTFPSQQFSFKQDKTSVQDLGTIIFVQNKENAWNTYVGTTNFVSLSGRGVISAENLMVIPGDAKILRQSDGTQINEGTQREMQGTFDKSILVNVQPSNLGPDTKTIFVMNPKLEMKIPKGTPPGRYRGLLTITSL